MSDEQMRQPRGRLSVTRLLSVVPLLVLAGCGVQTVQTFSTEQGGYETRYLTFDHPFTDAGAEEARRRAERQCGQKKQAPVKTKSACSLSKCTTSFQCMDPADAAKYSDGAGTK